MPDSRQSQRNRREFLAHEVVQKFLIFISSWSITAIATARSRGKSSIVGASLVSSWSIMVSLYADPGANARKNGSTSASRAIETQRIASTPQRWGSLYGIILLQRHRKKEATRPPSGPDAW